MTNLSPRSRRSEESFPRASSWRSGSGTMASAPSAELLRIYISTTSYLGPEGGLPVPRTTSSSCVEGTIWRSTITSNSDNSEIRLSLETMSSVSSTYVYVIVYEKSLQVPGWDREQLSRVVTEGCPHHHAQGAIGRKQTFFCLAPNKFIGHLEKRGRVLH